MDESKRGIVSRGTMGSNTIKNMYDALGTTFVATPDGPYEAEKVSDQDSAQSHFTTEREIKLRGSLGSALPATSYRDHYPPKDLPLLGDGLDLSGPTVPFTSRSEYMDEFWRKPWMGRPADALPGDGTKGTYKSPPWLANGTTNQHFFKPFEVPDGPPLGRHTRPAAPYPGMPDIYNTTYRQHYVPKDPQERLRPGETQRRAALPWLNDGTTYRNHYIPKSLTLAEPAVPELFPPQAFDATTEYRAEYTPKEREALLPPLTGTIAREGLQLPLPRKSLGVQFYHKGDPDLYYVIIPRLLDVPSAARQTFTTVHDNQEEACILILYGDDPVASNNMLLGQFDIVKIPPAPKGVPQIQVTFRLDKACFLTAEAKDLDTERHKLWIQRGDIIVLKH